MAPCGPFEPRPHVAVAFSGGADSLALLIGLIDWTRALGGRVTALIVDHGLRAGSADEARAAGVMAQHAGAAHEILDWTAAKPGSGIQAAARDARYRLLAAWCRAAGVLHLAVAHNADDQRETVAMRTARATSDGTGAGSRGLAGMSLIVARDGVRLLRPLLPVPAADIRAFLLGRGLQWIEDPSNAALQFERVRWRRGLEGKMPQTAEIKLAGTRRAEAEARTADLLMRTAMILPAGFALASIEDLRAADPATAGRALGCLIAMVSGSEHQPASAGLAELGRGLASGQLFSGRGMRTLGGALIGRWRGRLLVCREAARAIAVSPVARSRDLASPGDFIWDRRFLVFPTPAACGMTVAALGEAGLAEIGNLGLFQLKDNDIPAPARASLPALRDGSGHLVAVPHLGFPLNGAQEMTRPSVVRFAFRPYNSATSCGFTVA